ncbi:MAG: hypothetical protein DCC44_09940 [Acidobacteria bacterium]|nr:hypothetical protein [Pyrinomonadaceae bacterium]RIJ90982.1 MAG: hypothetical protein DCC44_09940 [Acidobacteriota bacterium]
MKTFIYSLMLLLMLSVVAFGQNGATDVEKWRDELLNESGLSEAENIADAAKYNLGLVWTAQDNSAVLGFIGTDHQRIRIKLLTAVRSGDRDLNTYAIGGASLVGTTFRRFTGTITITSFRYREPEDAAFEKELAEQRIKRRAVVLGRYTFTEEGSDAHTGTFSGIVYSAVYIDADDKAHYDDIELGADGYLNNQFAGRWRSRDGKLDLVCNWGDYRIPLSGGLDVGDGEFMPAKEYFKNGWQTYYDAYAKQDAAALKEEQRQWWRQTKRTKNK